MKTVFVMTAAAAALVFVGVVQAQPGPRGGEGGPGRAGMAIMMLGAADANGDNIVTKGEVEQLRREEFAWRDRNADGFLDREDASPTRQRLADMREGDAPSRRGRRGIARLDANEDQRISLDEFVSHEYRVFERLDSNGDDAISAQELDAAVEARESRRDARAWWRD